jgi:hypothetical protein
MRSGFDDNGVLFEIAPSIDELIAEVMQDEHQEAREPQLGVSALAALGHYHPQFDRRTGEIALPQARQALRGWQELGPAELRLGWPEELLALIVGAVLDLRRMSWMSARKVWEICLCTLMTMGRYWRPGEPLQLLVGDLFAPVDGRYEKSGRLAEQMSSLGRPVQRRALWSIAVVQSRLCEGW